MPSRLRLRRPRLSRLGTFGADDQLLPVSLAYARRILAGQNALARTDAEEIATCDLSAEMVRTDRERRACAFVEPSKILARLRRSLASREQASVLPLPPEPLPSNLAKLGGLLGLSAVDLAIVQFLVVLREEARLQELLQRFVGASLPQLARLVAQAVAAPPEDVLAAFQPEAPLMATSLCRMGHDSPFLEQRIELDQRLVEVLLTPGLGTERLLERFVPSAPPCSLEAADYAHIRPELELATRLVASAVARRVPGVNVLLHGPTGTGKTELARLLARGAGATLYVAGRESKSGESPAARDRLASLLLGNRLLSHAPSVLLFDELEDLFGSRSLGLDLEPERPSRGGTSKQWLNRLLETNAVPTIWITNELEGIDPAYLRRFSHSIELPPLGRVQRRRVWSRHLGEAAAELGEATVESLAQRFETSAAQVATVIRSARVASPDRIDVADLERLATASSALVEGRRHRAPAEFAPGAYDVSALQSSVDLVQLADRLAALSPAHGGASLCLYGPPGTGKTEFVRYLAHRLDRPLAVHRVSDLDSKWVGEAEKNIAQAFRAAEDDGALLVFDEADSFLRDRREAVRSWEVTRVNEFLQQLEAFRGVVACTTNLFRHLDPAALRRFSFKVPFDYPTPDKAARLFRLAFGAVTPITLDDAALARLLAETPNLAPGDFAAVGRRVRVLGGAPSVDTLVAELRLEASVKENARRAIGF